MELKNPILKGFNPDASILKNGKDYYIATSTFEWWPGIEIYHSRDLINWKLVAEPLADESQVDLKGTYNSGGIWAPHISFSEGKYWLIFTIVKSATAFKDTLNYIVYSEKITGPWSNPHFINASGFDPSLYHDDDGRHYFLNMLFDHRLDRPSFVGTIMQEIDLKNFKLLGQRKLIYTGTKLGVCEGPQMLKRQDWYYLICAAGGTSYSHAATVARSRNVWGPFQDAPHIPLMSTKKYPESYLQKCGHCSFVAVSEKEWYATFICARTLLPHGYCTLGRETGIQRILWEKGWPKLAVTNEITVPTVEILRPSIAKNTIQIKQNSTYCDFKEKVLPNYFKSLRGPIEKFCSLNSRKNYLRIYGGESLSSLHSQALIARRWQAFDFIVETALEYKPQNFQQMAGLILFYDTDNWIYLYISYDEEKEQRFLRIEQADLGSFAYKSTKVFLDNEVKNIYLKVEINKSSANFYGKFNKDDKFQQIGETVCADHLSDDYIKDHGKLAFTGAMVGICAQDMDDHSSFADFNYFNYIEN